MKLNHKQKVKLARKMRSLRETQRWRKDENGFPTYRGIFETDAWAQRKESIRQRLLKRNEQKTATIGV